MFQPILLKWIWVYAILIIIIGQLAWNFGLKNSKASDVSLATSFSPLAAIAIAMVILNEDRGSGLIPGGILMVFGIWVARSGQKSAVLKRESARKKPLELEKDVNFKGV
jgi:drug/metabolite transporter (DMT)-like permease